MRVRSTVDAAKMIRLKPVSYLPQTLDKGNIEQKRSGLEEIRVSVTKCEIGCISNKTNGFFRYHRTFASYPVKTPDYDDHQALPPIGNSLCNLLESHIQ